MKKFITLLLVLCMVFSLSVCAFADDAAEPDAPATGNDTTAGLVGILDFIENLFVGDNLDNLLKGFEDFFDGFEDLFNFDGILDSIEGIFTNDKGDFDISKTFDFIKDILVPAGE